ncbi:unnamed protein product [Pylaiella littoralis]
MGVGDDTVGGVQDAPFSPVRRGPIFTKTPHHPSDRHRTRGGASARECAGPYALIG